MNSLKKGDVIRYKHSMSRYHQAVVIDVAYMPIYSACVKYNPDTWGGWTEVSTLSHNWELVLNSDDFADWIKLSGYLTEEKEDLPKGKKEEKSNVCWHSMKNYQGFNESYNFCEHCDYKEPIDDQT